MTRVTNEELVAVVEGSADARTERRVLAAALEDPAVRRRLDLLRTATADNTPLPTLTAGEITRLQENLRVAARRVGREFQERAQGAVEPTVDWQKLLGARVRHAFSLPKRRLHLPALAPALAAPMPPIQVKREALETQGIHLEVHQLPEEPPRLRFYADASTAVEFIAGETTGVALALREVGATDLWVEVIPLNEEGRGVLELAAPLVQGGIELLAAALVTD
jgi:hypothetical protein